MVASVLGKDIQTGQLVTLEQAQRLGGMSFIGLSGFGKTTLLINLLLQDVKQGIGMPSRIVCKAFQ
jgi:putative ribosome biogenesis GTPase RsgA